MNDLILRTILEAQKEVTELELLLTKKEGHVIGGTIGYWLHSIYEGLTIYELELRGELSPKYHIPADYKFIKKDLKSARFGLKQIKFFLAFGNRIKEPKEKPNEVLEEFTK